MHIKRSECLQRPVSEALATPLRKHFVDVMSQNTHSPLADRTSESDDNVIENHVIPSNSVEDDLTANKSQEDHGWANFNAFENSKSLNSEEEAGGPSSDDWASFQSTTAKTSTDHAVEEVNNKTNDEDDGFGDYSDVQDSAQSQGPTLLVNSLSNEQIESVISSCFPLEPVKLCLENDSFLRCALPSFTTRQDQIKETSSFQQSLSLWDVLKNVSNDPLGIQYQWRKSNTERFFHQALGVHERFRVKLTPVISPSDVQNAAPTDNNENKVSSQTVTPSFDWKSSGLQNPLTANSLFMNIENPNSVAPTHSIKSENHVCDVNKTLDLDYYISPTSTSNREQLSASSPIVHRNSSPTIPSQQSIAIKTVDLFPGSTTRVNEDAKPVSDSVPNYTSINPKALLFSTQITTESNTLY